MSKILLLEDDLSLINGLSFAFKKQGFELNIARTLKEADALWADGRYDLLVLDVSLPDGTGFEFCKRVRQVSKVPIIFLTASDEETSIIMGLDMGGDDYITKPFSPSVLCAKVKACLRRMSLSAPSSSGVLSAGPFCYFSDEMRLLKKGIEVPLSSKESFLMKYFLTNQNKVLTKEQIYRSIWGDNVVDDNTIMVHIRRLRTKIEDDPNKPLYLRTIRGVGYQFVAE